MAPGMSLYAVNAILILDTEGSRVYAKWFTPPFAASGAGAQAGHTHTAPTATAENPYPDLKSQLAFEKGLLEKTVKQTGDVILYDNRLVLYKAEGDVILYVIGNPDENEVLLYNVCLALRDSLYLLFKQSVDKRTIVENYDVVTLTVDEIVDDGVILETDAAVIIQRVSKAPAQDINNLSRIDPFSEQGVNNLAQLGRAKLSDWLRQGL